MPDAPDADRPSIGRPFIYAEGQGPESPASVVIIIMPLAPPLSFRPTLVGLVTQLPVSALDEVACVRTVELTPDPEPSLDAAPTALAGCIGTGTGTETEIGAATGAGAAAGAGAGAV